MKKSRRGSVREGKESLGGKDWGKRRGGRRGRKFFKKKGTPKKQSLKA